MGIRLLPLNALFFVCSSFTFAAFAQEKTADTKLPELVTPAISQAIDEGVEFLLEGQVDDGSFGQSGGSHRVGTSALCGIALLGEYQREENTELKDAIRSCAEYLLLKQKNNGLIAGPSGVLYEHAYALQFLGAFQQQFPEDSVKKALSRAANCSASAQNETGGWRYMLGSKDADSSATACQLVGLLAAQKAGIEELDGCIQRGVDYLESCQLEDGSFAYIQGVKSKAALPRSAAAMAVLLQVDKADKAVVRSGQKFLQNATPDFNAHFFYGEYYQGISWLNAKPKKFRTWYKKTADQIVEMRGEQKHWTSKIANNEYATAAACITLLSPYQLETN
ncbi:MAG: prenyltransferase/squalene oxidase repeat-containing protein [Planctomycetota bacterium]